MAQYQVSTLRFPTPETKVGLSDPVPLPEGWLPLAAHVQGETTVVFCYQELLEPVD